MDRVVIATLRYCSFVHSTWFMEKSRGASAALVSTEEWFVLFEEFTAGVKRIRKRHKLYTKRLSLN